jgi:hypothetical protein
MQLVSTVTLGTAASSITFSSIPQTATDLLVLFRGRANNTQNAFRVQFNSDAGANYSQRILNGTGSSVTSTSTTGGTYISTQLLTPSTYTANTFSNISVYIPNYTSSSAKSLSIDGVQENNSTAANQQIVAGLWSGTAAITSLTVLTSGGSFLFAADTTASLYIITKA